MNQDSFWANLIWKEALQTSVLPWGWGFNPLQIETIDKGTAFPIAGNGKVKIQHEGWSNCFQITLSYEKDEFVVQSVMLQDVASVIDASIKYYHNSHIQDLAIAI